MWTHTLGIQSHNVNQSWTPNHFVPLLEMVGCPKAVVDLSVNNSQNRLPSHAVGVSGLSSPSEENTALPPAAFTAKSHKTKVKAKTSKYSPSVELDSLEVEMPVSESTRLSFVEDLVSLEVPTSETVIANDVIPKRKRRRRSPATKPAPRSPLPREDTNATAPDISLLSDPGEQTFIVPEPVVVPELTETAPSLVEVAELPELIHTVVSAGTSKSKRRLVSSHNHVYNYKKTLKRSGATVWQCSVRNAEIYCTAVVTQLGDAFTAGSIPHKCIPKACALQATNVRVQIKTDAKCQAFTHASTIVNSALQIHLPSSAPTESLPQITTLVRQANKVRQGDRPTDPTTLEFDIKESAIPDNFMRGDIRVGEKRHIIMATGAQLELLAKAVEWYCDGTFKAVGIPFSQLWTIHAFVREGASIKQVPLAYVLMSGKSQNDYTAVLREIIQILPTPPSVSTVMLDFEAALWAALHVVMPNVQIRGCSFHWSQAVWRKVQELGLAAAYLQNNKTHKFIRRILCLPFLPAEHIEPVFRGILALDTTATPMAESLRMLLNYMRTTWIESTIWPPAAWSVFNRSVRTNNDTEGWHRRLNSIIHRHNLPFYQLIDILHKESAIVETQLQFVTDEKLKRSQRAHYRRQQTKIFSLWDSFVAGNVDAKALLKEISTIYRPPTRI
jgi:hypothetical protein